MNLLLPVIYFDAAVVLLAGLAAAGLILTGKDMQTFWTRVLPATMTIVLTTLAAAAILGVGKHFLG